MKKIICLLLMALNAFCFFSCDKENDEDKNTLVFKEAILGTWIVDHCKEDLMTFNSDGTFHYEFKIGNSIINSADGIYETNETPQIRLKVNGEDWSIWSDVSIIFTGTQYSMYFLDDCGWRGNYFKG